MINFADMGQPSERKLRTLPTWALEWMQTLKYRVLFWHHRAEGREVSFAGRVQGREPNAADVFHLPFWAQDWMDLLAAESIAQRDRYYGNRRKLIQGGMADVGTESKAGRSHSYWG